MLKPKAGESREDFVRRAVESPEAIRDFPNHSARHQVAENLFAQRNNRRFWNWREQHKKSFGR